MLNTSRYQKGEGYSEKAMSDQNDLSKKGKLIKRPLVVLNGVGICGFKREAWTRIFEIIRREEI